MLLNVSTTPSEASGDRAETRGTAIAWPISGIPSMMAPSVASSVALVTTVISAHPTSVELGEKVSETAPLGAEEHIGHEHDAGHDQDEDLGRGRIQIRGDEIHGSAVVRFNRASQFACGHMLQSDRSPMHASLQ